MMETLGLVVIVLTAVYYIFRHMKRTLTVGEEEAKCQNCPVINMPIPDSKRSVNKNETTN
jgi:hypothetical protein